MHIIYTTSFVRVGLKFKNYLPADVPVAVGYAGC